ncbi:unnamed protein product, partial [Amoebophrya sp. A120]
FAARLQNEVEVEVGSRSCTTTTGESGGGQQHLLNTPFHGVDPSNFSAFGATKSSTSVDAAKSTSSSTGGGTRSCVENDPASNIKSQDQHLFLVPSSTRSTQKLPPSPLFRQPSINLAPLLEEQLQVKQQIQATMPDSNHFRQDHVDLLVRGVKNLNDGAIGPGDQMSLQDELHQGDSKTTLQQLLEEPSSRTTSPGFDLPASAQMSSGRAAAPPSGDVVVDGNYKGARVSIEYQM